MSGHTPGTPFGIPSPLAYPPYPAFTTGDLFFLSIAVWVVFGILWLILYLPFRVLPTTIVFISVSALFLLATPFEPWLFVATIGGGTIGYICARRRPVSNPPEMMRNLISRPPLDDVEFDGWASHVLKIAGSATYEAYLTSGWMTGMDKLQAKFVVVSCDLYRHSVTWSLIAICCFFFVYSLAYNSLPLGLQVIVVAIAAAAAAMQLGVLAKRRSAEKQIAQKEREVF